MKYFILLASLTFSAPVWAISECAGRASDGAFVLIHVDTTTAAGIASSGSVSFEKDGNKYGYRFSQPEIAQYFEYDDISDGSAVVGVSAYAQKDNPVSVKYVGQNFIDSDLKAVIDGGLVQTQKKNMMRVWKGPGRVATDQYQLTQIACAVWSNL